MKTICVHHLEPCSPALQRNAFRIENMWAEPRCAMLPKRDQFGRQYDPIRFVLSGGSSMDAAYPCVGPDSPWCPRNVEAESSVMNDGKAGPCPKCRTVNRRPGFGPVACRDCGYLFNLVDA